MLDVVGWVLEVGWMLDVGWVLDLYFLRKEKVLCDVW